ncbi:hypothetical protein D3C86_1220100 [compost metagenome]
MLVARHRAEQAAAKHLTVAQPGTANQPLHRGASERAGGFRFQRPGSPTAADLFGKIQQQGTVHRPGLRLDLDTLATYDPLFQLVEQADHDVVVFIKRPRLLTQADRRHLHSLVGSTALPLGIVGATRHGSLIGLHPQAVTHSVGCPAWRDKSEQLIQRCHVNLATA